MHWPSIDAARFARFRKAFERTFLRSVVVGLVAIIATGLLFWVLELFNPPIAVKTAIGNVLGLVLVGILTSLLTQAYVLHATTEELMTLVGVEKTLRDAGLEGVTDSRRVDWDKFLESSDTLVCILGEPALWITREWDIVKEVAQRRKVRVIAFFERPRMDVAADTTLTDAPQPEGPYSKVQSDWVDLTESDRLTIGSSLTIRLASDLPRYSVFLAGTKAMVFLHHLAGAPNPPGALVLQLKQMAAAATPVAWLENAEAEIERATGIHFEREYRGPRAAVEPRIEPER